MTPDVTELFIDTTAEGPLFIETGRNSGGGNGIRITCRLGCSETPHSRRQLEKALAILPELERMAMEYDLQTGRLKKRPEETPRRPVTVTSGAPAWARVLLEKLVPRDRDENPLQTIVWRATLWSRYDNERQAFVFNHLEYGQNRSGKPAPQEGDQAKNWERARWERRFVDVVAGTVVTPPATDNHDKEPACN